MDDDGNIDEAITTAPVSEDASADVAIVDDMGLQSDGTGIVGDTLRVSYGSTFGTPSSVTWYRNGSVVNASGTGNSPIALTLQITAARGAGTYMATVVSDGKTYTTNEIIITNKEEQAEILAFTLEDDYTDGNFITYDSDDDTVIATLTLSKNYVGTVQIWKSTDSKYSTEIDTFTTVTGAPGANADATNTNGNDNGAAALINGAATNFQMTSRTAGGALGWYNPDGTVTYKVVLNDGIKTRGQDYVATFDQDSFSNDSPRTGTANVSEEATVPYVKAIDEIAVTKVANGTAPEVTFYGEDGNVLGWYGTAVAATTLATAGIDKCGIYGSKIMTNDKTTSGLTENTTNTGCALRKGVWTSNAPAGNDAFWFAYVTTKKGIFAEGAETIVSEAVPNAQDAATTIQLVENKDTATSAEVQFTNLRTPGTVYIVRGYYQETAGNTTNAAWDVDHYTTPANIYTAFDVNDPNTYVAKATVATGAEKAVVSNAISKWQAVKGTPTTDGAQEKWEGNNYIAVFIPDDQTNYGMVYTDGKTSTGAAGDAFNDTFTVNATTEGDRSGVTINQKLTKYALNTLTNNGGTVLSSAAAGFKDVGGVITGAGAAAAATAKLILVKDQFGTEIDTDTSDATWDKTWTFEKTNSEGVTDNVLTLAWDADNGNDGATTVGDKITIAAQNPNAGGAAMTLFAADETYTAKTGTDQTITLTVVTPGAGTAATPSVDTTTTFKLSIS